MSMNNPQSTRPRDPYQPVRNNSTGWITGAVAVVIVAGLAWWAMGNRHITASNPPVTIGQQTTPVSPPPASQTPSPRPSNL
jgi:hypothetical protein